MMSKIDLTIRIAGNTTAPALSVIKGKGYEIEFYVSTDTGYARDCVSCYNARKDGRLFSATTAVELLGLIAMWEVRGDNWRGTKDDFKLSSEIDDSCVIYGPDGTIIEKFEKE